MACGDRPRGCSGGKRKAAEALGTHSPEGARMFKNHLSNVKLQLQQGTKGETLTEFTAPFPHSLGK